jgi:hypothetical protein
MVAITKDNDNIVFEIKGIHKLWAFRHKITVLKENIVSVRPNPDALKNGWKGLRLLGTSLPFLFAAGIFYQQGKKVFWDVSKEKNCIVVELNNSTFSQLVIEVENPEAAMVLLA